MAEQFAAPPINPVIGIRPVNTPPPGRDAPNVQSQLANLPAGTVVQGFVINRDVQNNPILRTPIGDLQVTSDVFLKTGSEVVIRVDATIDSRARIVTIDGMTPQDYAAQTARGLTKDTIIPSALLPSGTAVPLPGAATTVQAPLPLQAMLLTPAPQMAAATQMDAMLKTIPGSEVPLTPGLLKLQAGAGLKVMLLQLQLPQMLDPAAPTALPSSPTSQAAAPQPHAPITQAPTGSAPHPAMQQPSVNTPLGTQAAPLPSQTPSSQPLQAFPHAPVSAVSSAIPSPAGVAPIVPTAPSMPGVSPAIVASAVASQPAAPTTMQPLPPPALAANPVPMPAAAQQAYGHAPIATVQRTTPSQSSHMPVEAKPHAQPLPPNTVAAVVIGHEKDGTNILHTKLGVVKMMTPTPLPMHAGATLQIQADDLPPLPSLPTLLTPEELAALSTRSRDWPQLEEAVSWLNVHDAPAARDVMQAIPQVGAKLTSGLIFFMVAVKGGDLKQWIGSKALARLEASAPDIASKLKGDMAQLQQLLLHSPLEQWSGAMIPLLYQGELSYTKLYLRDEQQGEPEKAQGKGGQRFILEVELSHLGEMQLDGFVQGPTNKKQFDLIIRTSKTLPNDVSQEIRTLFDTALKTTGYQGYLGFQHGSQHFVRPLAAGGPGENPPHHQTILA